MARSSSGISLVSVLIALALLATTAVAVSRLIVTGFAGSRLTRQNFVAIQIAREGLELIRAQRDTNWFDASIPKPAWTKNICDLGGSDLIFDSAMARNNIAPLTTTTGAPENTLSRRRDDGEFVHSTDNTEATIYSRVITVNCTDPAFIEVTSTVSWKMRGAPHNLELKERLFNWLPITL